ncbi:hypothetical protein SAVCW2_46630 [Streptomyces avermitilis]|nr:hypothetical protein SAVCW2_46630 [Streptomyces avermitilis]
MSFGITGAPLPRFTWVPGLPSWSPPMVDMPDGGVAESVAVGVPVGVVVGVPVGVAVGVAAGLPSANAVAGAVSERVSKDRSAAEVTGRRRLAVLFEAGTVENVQGGGTKSRPGPADAPHPGAVRRRTTAILNP